MKAKELRKLSKEERLKRLDGELSKTISSNK
jgi:ribosomal protein L29